MGRWGWGSVRRFFSTSCRFLLLDVAVMVYFIWRRCRDCMLYMLTWYTEEALCIVTRQDILSIAGDNTASTGARVSRRRR